MRISTKNISLYVVVALFILIIAFIFSNSLKNGEESNAQSQPIVEAIEALLDPNDKIPTTTFNYIVRKAAHITEFTALGMTLAGYVWCINRSTMKRTAAYKQRIAAAGGIGLLAAIADEIIQIFTGRTSSFSDVLIDFFGVVFGMAIVLTVCRWLENHAKKSL